MGLVAQSRYLLKQAFQTADSGHPASAAMHLRSLTESALTLQWLMIDLPLTHLLWLLDGIKKTLAQHDEVRRNEKNHRRRQRRQGMEPGPSNLPPGLLYRRNLLAYKDERARLTAQIRALPRLNARAKRAQIALTSLKLPTLEKRAKAARLGHIYSLGYRFDSQSAAHPTRLAIEQYLEPVPAGVKILDVPTGTRADPYLTGAALVLIALKTASKIIHHSGIDPHLDEIVTEIAGLGSEGLL